MNVFLSYCSENSDLARRLGRDLRRAGVDVWFDQWELDVGEEFVRSVEEGVDAASVLIVLVTRASVASPFVEREWRRKAAEEARTGRVAIVPVRGEPCEMPDFLARRSHTDIRDGCYAQGFRRLLEILHAHPEGSHLEIPSIEAIARDASGNMIPITTPIAIDVGLELLPIVAPDGSGDGRFMGELVPGVRHAFEREFGFPLCGLRIRGGADGLHPRAVAILVEEIPEATLLVDPDAVLVDREAEQLGERGIRAVPHGDPAGTGRVRATIAASDRDVARGAGCSTWDAAEYVALAVHAVARRTAPEFIGVDLAHRLVQAARRSAPRPDGRILPPGIRWTDLAGVLRRLVEEEVSIGDMERIIESIDRSTDAGDDVLALTERARHALRAEITARVARPGGTVDVLAIEPEIEACVLGAIVRSPTGAHLALEPRDTERILGAFGRMTGRLAPAARNTPMLVSNARIRRLLRQLLALDSAAPCVLSREDLEPGASIRVVDVVGSDAVAPSPAGGREAPA